ncbi:MAG TPA: hypothetical protein VH855_10610 [Acetobacteraceae bacterium]|jgi:hypothetical protein
MQNASRVQELERFADELEAEAGKLEAESIGVPRAQHKPGPR